MRRLGYFLGEAWLNLRLNRATTLIAVATMAFTLVCFGVFLLLYVNLKELAGSLQNEIKVVVYLAEDPGLKGVSDLQRRLKSEPEVASVLYISKEQALTEFRAQFPSEQHLLDGLGENPLPASFVLTIAPPFRSSPAVKRLSERLAALPGVAQVQYSQDWIENLAGMVRYFELGALAVGGILSVASMTIIANTVRLTLYARKDEIEIMRLIGATRTFINIPYLLEGAMLGALGGAVSLGMLKGGFEFVKLQLASPGRVLGMPAGFSFLPGSLWALILLAGLVLGCTGSLVSVLELRKPR
jgi:cell division transport system permease protein